MAWLKRQLVFYLYYTSADINYISFQTISAASDMSDWDFISPSCSQSFERTENMIANKWEDMNPTWQLLISYWKPQRIYMYFFINKCGITRAYYFTGSTRRSSSPIINTSYKWERLNMGSSELEAIPTCISNTRSCRRSKGICQTEPKKSFDVWISNLYVPGRCCPNTCALAS